MLIIEDSIRYSWTSVMRQYESLRTQLWPMFLTGKAQGRPNDSPRRKLILHRHCKWLSTVQPTKERNDPKCMGNGRTYIGPFFARVRAERQCHVAERFLRSDA